MKEEGPSTSSRETVKTGRELDAEVAERVMGWKRPPGYNYWMSFPAGETFKLHALIATWKPSESIETAMQVVEKMRERGVWTQIQIFTHTTQVRVEMGVPSSECQEWGDTAAEAICKCALKALDKFNPSAALSAVDSQGDDQNTV